MTRTLTKMTLAGLVATLMMSGAAMAQPASVEATVDLNLRSGPGPQYETIGLIKTGDAVMLNGCLSGSKWCEVDQGGTVGWAYSDYLVEDTSGSIVVLTERQAELPVVEYEDDDEGAVAAGAVSGAVIGALIGGPIGAVVGGAAGAAVGDLSNPPEEVQTYVRGQDVDTVYLDGEVVIGAEVPDVVELAEIPEHEDYRYARINGQVVIIDPSSRRILYVVRD